VLTGLVAFYVAYGVATLGALAVLWQRGETRPFVLVPAALLCLVAVSLPLALVVLRRRAERREPAWIERWPGARDVAAALRGAAGRPLFAPPVLAQASLLQLAIFALDSATLAATLRALGTAVDPPLVFASFTLASVVSTLAWSPGGLGTFEASCVALLHWHGVRLEAALGAVLLLRAFTFWLPMLPGFLLARRELAARARG